MYRWRAVNELLLCGILIVAIGGLLWWQSTLFDSASVATLVGALVGALAVLLGNWITRRNERARAEEALDARRAALKTLIAAELANVAAGLFQAKTLIDAAVDTVRVTAGTIPAPQIARALPREMPITAGLGAELLQLEQPALDALVTLQLNLRVTVEQFADLPPQLGLIRLEGLAGGLRFDMGVLAECYEHIAPTRELRMPGNEPARASEMLRRSSERSP